MAKRETFAWFKFYPGDYLRATRHMTLEQRGAYMDAICLQMERGGALPDDCSWLAHQMHISTRKARAIVDELIELQKLRRAPEGLVNDRCLEEIAERQAQRSANAATAQKREADRRAARGVVDDKSDVSRLVREDFTAEPKLNQGSLNLENSEKPSEINARPAAACHEESTTRARVESEKKEKRRDICAADAAPGSPLSEAFEVFWQAFPAERRRGKGKCREIFVGLATGRDSKKRRASPETLIAAVKAGHGIDPNFPPLPETWLNQGRWEDAPAAAAEPAPVNGKAWNWWHGKEVLLRGLPVERWRKAIEEAKPNGTWPWWVLGAPPGHAECLVPKELLDQYGFTEIYKGNISHG